tara:strand:+ start:214 stop:723 length:510 start_codon:yes stop_codon:yes gene_type:complete
LNKSSHLIALGTLGRPYKFLGELYFFPYNIDSQISLKKMNVMVGKNKKNIDDMFVEEFSSISKVLKFKDIDSRELASSLSKSKLFIYREQMPQLSNNEYYLVDLIGCLVCGKENEKIGIVKDVISLPSNDVVVIEKNKKEHLIPLIDDIIKFIDIKNKRIEIIVIPGLL